MKELHIISRPKRLEDVIGQPEVIEALKRKYAKGAIPSAIALTGPSGCGKTTIAFILKRLLGAKNDFHQVECGKEGGIDTIRKITDGEMQLVPKGKAIMFLLEEAHKLTDAAQQALLVPTEHPPPNVYWVISTTDWQKIIPALKSRFMEFKLKPLHDEDMLSGILKPALLKSKSKVSDKVLTKIIECSDGSPRRALRFLEKVLDLDSDRDRLSAIEPDAVLKVAFDLVKILLWDRPSWEKAVNVLKGLTEEPETVRRMIMSVAGTELLKCNKNADRAAGVIKSFQYFLDSGKAGYSQLLVMAYDCCRKGK